MKMLIVTGLEKTELVAVNYGGNPTKQIEPVALEDGRFALNADLLEDCGPGQTWEYYGAFLKALPVEVVSVLTESTMQ
jgi:hypothetical protein